MAIEVKNNINLQLKLKEFTKKTAIELKTALIDAASEIRIRTSQGRDVSGATFKKYSDKYAAKKLKEGRQVYPPNLTQTGRMLASSGKVEIIETNGNVYGKIGFTDRESSDKGKANQEKRLWFGLSEKQKTIIINRLRGK